MANMDTPCAKRRRLNNVKRDYHEIISIHSEMSWSDSMDMYYNDPWGFGVEEMDMDEMDMDEMYKDEMYKDEMYKDEMYKDEMYKDEMYKDEMYKDKMYMDEMYMDEVDIDEIDIFEMDDMPIQWSELSLSKQKTKCAMCGSVNHLILSCPHSCCLKCGERSANFVKECIKCETQASTICEICGSRGHSKYNCPYVWKYFRCTISTKSVAHFLTIFKSYVRQ